MKAEIKTKWIEALRSGNYKQATDALYCESTDAYCCLGVLQKVCEKEGVWLPQDGGGDEFLSTDPCFQTTGLTFDDQKRLWTMNDSHKKSFAEIADFIEAQH